MQVVTGAVCSPAVLQWLACGARAGVRTGAKWSRLQVPVQGKDPLKPETDICIAGLGWVSVGLWGEATVKVWTPPGIAVTRRAALLTTYAKDFERPGWSNNSKSLFIKDPSKPYEQPVSRPKKKKRRGPVTAKKAKAGGWSART